MAIPAASIQNISLTLPASALNRLQLTPNTLINARVLDVQDQKVTLQVQGQTLPARTTLPLQPGQQLTLLVQQNGNQWRLIPQAPAQTQSASALPAPLQSLLSPPASSPQTALNTLLQQLPSVIQLAPAAQPLLEKLQQQRLRIDSRLRPPALKHAIQNAGVFMENRLVQQQPVQQDIKALLFRLLNMTEARQDKQRIDEIKKVIRGISHYQARSLMDDWLGIPLFFTSESPFREGSLWFKKREITSDQPDTPHRWQAIVQLEFKHFGPFEALVQYDEKTDTLHIQLWCAHPALSERMEACQHLLVEKLPNVQLSRTDTPPSQQIKPAISLDIKV